MLLETDLETEGEVQYDLIWLRLTMLLRYTELNSRILLSLFCMRCKGDMNWELFSGGQTESGFGQNLELCPSLVRFASRSQFSQ